MASVVFPSEMAAVAETGGTDMGTDGRDSGFWSVMFGSFVESAWINIDIDGAAGGGFVLVAEGCGIFRCVEFVRGGVAER